MKNPKNMNFWEKSFVFGEINLIFGKGVFSINQGGMSMVKRGYKGRCEKQRIEKCKEVCRTYNPIQKEYANLLSKNDEILEIHCNVLMEGLEDGDYTSDFVCTKQNGDLMVRECVYRNHLLKPRTMKLLEASRKFWLSHGVYDWGIVVEKEVVTNENEINA